jgi:hypothetical protein
MTKRETYDELRHYHTMIDDNIIEEANIRIMIFRYEHDKMQSLFKVVMKDGEVIQVKCIAIIA